MNRVQVDVPVADGDALVGSVAATGRVSRFFSGETFRTTYGTAIDDVPAHVRPLPILAQVCPVAWATGADVTVPTVDATFLEALRRIRSTLLDMYPEFMQGGKVHCPNPVHDDPGTDGDGGAGMLFTGGVDSTATFLRHRADDPELVSVRGWVVGPDEDERWERTENHVRSFADHHDVATHFVESNMLDFLDMPLLQAHFQRYLDGSWYAAVGHGLGLLGLCAPLADARGWDSLYIAASHTPEWRRPWGSHPDIDDQVAWSGTECVHDGFELSRQEKIDRIAAYVDAESDPLPLRTCIYDDGTGNCSDCEKCYRTIVGLLLAGLDPNDHGYDCDGETLRAVREGFESGRWTLKSHTRYHWEVLQRAAGDRTIDERYGDGSFLEWFRAQDLREYSRDSSRSLKRRLLQFAARHAPGRVYATLYPLYRRLATLKVPARDSRNDARSEESPPVPDSETVES